MNRRALVALLLGIGMGGALMASPAAFLTTRWVGALSLTTLLVLFTLPLVAFLRRLPRWIRIVAGVPALLYGLQALYWLLRHHWASGGLLVLGGLAVIATLWSIPWRVPRPAVAAFCGLAAVVLWSGFAPRDLFQGAKRWRNEARTRTPLGVATHGGLLLSLGLFPLLGVATLSSRSGSGETAPT